MKKTLEEMKVDRLYELLNMVKNGADNELIAALKWAIFELESRYCREK